MILKTKRIKLKKGTLCSFKCNSSKALVSYKVGDEIISACLGHQAHLKNIKINKIAQNKYLFIRPARISDEPLCSICFLEPTALFIRYYYNKNKTKIWHSWDYLCKNKNCYEYLLLKIC